MGPQEMRKAMKACTQNHAPECTATCPVHVDARGLWRAVREGDFDTPLASYARSVLFPCLVGAFCTAPCETRCAKGRRGQAVAIRALEESLCLHGQRKALQIVPYMALHKKVAIVGGGISGLAAALFLYEKGFPVTIFEKTGRLGGRGWELDPARAEADFAFLRDLPWRVELNCQVGRDIPLEKVLATHDGVYLSGELALAKGALWDEATCQSAEEPKLFLGGSILRKEQAYSIIDSIASGRHSGISLDRFLKTVSLTASRHGEGSYRTELFTDIDEDVPVNGRVVPENGCSYTRAEAVAEAGRCLNCQCLRCVKQCVYMQHFGNYPFAIIQEMATHIGMIVGQRQSGPLINSCSLCGLCEELCPNATKMPDSARSARQFLVEKGQNVEAVHDFPLRDMAFSNGEDFWLWSHGPGETASQYLFFPGCQLAATLPGLLLPTYRYLREKLGGKVGVGLGCCGAPAHWSGYEARYQDGMEVIHEAWQEMGEPTLLVACPTCHKQLAASCPDIPVLSLWELFAKEGLPAPLATRASAVFSIQDACGSRHMPEVHKAVRHLLLELGCPVQELRHNQNETKCCNYGGLMLYGNRGLAAEALHQRLGESEADFLVYCGACREQCQRGGKETWHLLEVLFGQKEPAVVDITEKRHNRRRVKQEFRKACLAEGPVEREAQMKLLIDDELRCTLDERLILEEDVVAVIQAAETSGKRLKSPKTGHYLAHLQPGIITYWVEYLPAEGGYRVFNAYSHRLQIVDD